MVVLSPVPPVVPVVPVMPFVPCGPVALLVGEPEQANKNNEASAIWRMVWAAVATDPGGNKQKAPRLYALSVN